MATFLSLPHDLARAKFYSRIDLYNRLARLCKATNRHCKSPEVLRKISEEPLSKKEIERASLTCLKFGYRVSFERPISLLPHPLFVTLNIPNPVSGQATITIKKSVHGIDDTYFLNFIGYITFHDNIFYQIDHFNLNINFPLYTNSLSRALSRARELGYTEPSYHLYFFAHKHRNVMSPMNIVNLTLMYFDRQVAELYSLAEQFPQLPERIRFFPLVNFLLSQIYDPFGRDDRDELLEKLEKKLVTLQFLINKVRRDTMNFLVKISWFLYYNRVKN